MEKKVREAYQKRANYYLKQAINYSTLGQKMNKISSDMQKTALIDVPVDLIQWHTLLSEPNSYTKVQSYFEKRLAANAIDALQDVALETHQLYID